MTRAVGLLFSALVIAAVVAASSEARHPYGAIRLSVSPTETTAGREQVFTFRATRAGRPVARVTVHLAGRRVRTGRNGRARMTVTLPAEGTYVALATRRGFRRDRVRVVAKKPDGGPAPAGGSAIFTGRCEFSGAVTFDPPMTNSGKPTTQRAEAPGTCTGSFVDARGTAHQLADAPVTYRATAQGDDVSCGSGIAEGEGYLAFQDGDLHFHFSEKRIAATPLVQLTGVKSGSAAAFVTPGASQDPVQSLADCAAAGLKRFALDARMETTPSISG